MARLTLCLHLLAITGLSACERVPSDTEAEAPAELTSFEFRQLRPGHTTPDEAEKNKVVNYCMDREATDAFPAETSCYFQSYSVGEVAVGASSVLFTDGKFDWFSVDFHPANFQALREQLSGVYGEPCREEDSTLQNAYGAEFEGGKVEWCFKEGRLTLQRRTENDVTKGALMFFSNRPEPTTPPRTYDKNTL